MALVVVQRLERGDRHLCIGGVVQRTWRVVPGEPPEAGVLGVFLCRVGAVTQDDGRQRCSAWGAPAWPGEPLTHKGGQVAAVVPVRMGQHDIGDRARPYRQLLPVQAPPGPLTLAEGRSPPESFARRARAGNCCR